jgi:ABC-type branched-subunit amino acid transport system permease subunit
VERLRWRPFVAILACLVGVALAWGLAAVYVLVLGTTEPSAAGDQPGPRGGLPWLLLGAVLAAAAGPIVGWHLLRNRSWILASAVLGVVAAALLVLVTVGS